MTADTVTETEEKAAFAALLLRERDPFKAALTLFPNNTNRALFVATKWPTDPEFLALQKSVRENFDELSLLPTKAQFAQLILERMEGKRPDGSIIPPDTEDFAKLGKLFADVLGFIEKPQAPSNSVTLIMPKVIEVPTHGTDEEWELAAGKQQHDLLNVSRSKH